MIKKFIILNFLICCAQANVSPEFIQLKSGETHELLLSFNKRTILEFTSNGIDLSVHVIIDNEKAKSDWKIASWRGESGTFRIALDENESKNVKLSISTTNKKGPTGTYRIENISLFNNDIWTAERDLMKGLNLHYRQYLGESDERDNAILLMKSALKLWIDKGESEHIARVSFELASIQRKFGKSSITQAYENYTLAVDNWLMIYDKNSAAKASNLLGLIDRANGNYDNALINFHKAKKWREELELYKAAAVSDSNIGLIERDRGNLLKAVKSFKNAIMNNGWTKYLEIDIADNETEEFIEEIAKEGNIKRASIMFNNLALAHDDLGDHKLAISLWSKALLLNEYISDQVSIASILNNIGKAYFSRGRLDEAFDNLNKAYVILDRIKNIKKLSSVKFNLATLFALLGKNEYAKDYYLSAIKLRKDSGYKKGYFDSLLALGHVYEDEKNYNKALKNYLKAEKGFIDLELKGRLGNVKLSIAELKLIDKNYDEALLYATQANSLLYDYGSIRDYGRSLHFLGEIHFFDKKHRLAKNKFEDSLDYAIQAENKLIQPKIYLSLSKTHFNLNDITQALAYAKLSISLFESLSNKLDIPGDRASFNSNYHLAITYYCQLLIANGEIKKALVEFDKSRIKTFGYWASEDDEDNKLEELTESLYIKEKLKLTVSGKNKQSLINDLNTDIRDLYRQIEKLGKQSQINKTPVSDIPELPDDTAVLEYMLDNNQAHVYLVYQGKVTVFVLPDLNELRSLASQLHESLNRHDRQSWNNVSKILSSKIIPNELRDMPINKIVIIADDVLQTVPFSALQMDGKLLIDLFEINNAPSLSLYSKLINDVADMDIKVDVFADAIYDKNDNRFNESSALISTPIFKINNITRSGSSLSRLPNTLKEAQSIKKLNPNNVNVTLGFQVSRVNYLKSIKESSVLHFALHSIPNEKMAGMSSIELSRYDSSFHEINSSLTANDINRNKMNSQLIVLSACETSKGQYLKGEGYIGLTRSFFEAGAKTVVSSLWKVDDESTAVLMEEFYRQLFNGKSVIESLRNSQKQVSHMPRFRDPYYWAGFVVSGNGDLKFKKQAE